MTTFLTAGFCLVSEPVSRFLRGAFASSSNSHCVLVFCFWFLNVWHLFSLSIKAVTTRCFCTTRFRDVKLEERGAGFGSKTPPGQESRWWVWGWSFVPHVVSLRDSFPAEVQRRCILFLGSQMRSRCWWCGTAHCRWRSKTWRSTARRESAQPPGWESSSVTSESPGLDPLAR